MKTFILVITIIATNNMETNTYKFTLPLCGRIGETILVQDPRDLVAVMVECRKKKNGRIGWSPLERERVLNPTPKPDERKKL